MQSTPLVNREGRVLGVFSTHYRSPHRPCTRELRLLDLLARQAADIIDCVQNDVDLRRSEAQLRQFIEYAPVALAMFDREMRYLAVSQRWLADYRLDETVIGRSHYEVFPELPDRWKAVHQRALAGEVIREDEDHFKRGDGADQWLRWEVRPWYTRERAIGGILIFAEDITIRKRAEKAVQSSQAQLEAALESMSDAVYISDATGHVTHSNHACARFHKFKDKQECARSLTESPSFLEVYTSEGQLASLPEKAIARALGGETAVGAEYTLHRRDTGDTWIGSYNFAPIRDEAGMVVGSVVTGRDITDQRNAERTLEASQAEIRAYAQHLDGAIESERLHLAREIHDVLGQMLTALRMDLTGLGRRLKPPITEAVLCDTHTRLGELTTLTDEIIKTVRHLAGELRPVLLNHTCLDQAIKLQWQRFTERTGIPCVTRDVHAAKLSEDRALAAYRTFQEALTNIARHDPNAKQVTVALTSDDERFTLEVVNLGRTISETEASDPCAFGLIGMRERAIALGGQCTIAGIDRKGTLVRLTAPLRSEETVALP
jgi:PAS domain S-box-containing protein